MIANKVKIMVLKDGQPYELSVKWQDIDSKPDLITQEELEQKGYQNEAEVNELIQAALDELKDYDGETDLHLQSKIIKQNGLYVPDEGYIGFSEVEINVPTEAVEEYDGTIIIT